MDRRQFVKQSAAIGLTIGGGLYFSGAGSTRADPISVLRPPGAVAEDEFLATCIRCMRCVDACPNRAITSFPQMSRDKRGGTPVLHMRRASCMLCAGQEGDYLKCTEACPSGALQTVRKERDEILEKVRIGVARIDEDLCYSYNNWSCGACVRACPFAGQAMTLGMWERPTVHPEACVGCGCCERACIRYPHAIRVKVLDKRSAGQAEIRP